MEIKNSINLLNNDEINDNIIINDKENSFNRLCQLQKLIKRESALKELCKKNYNRKINIFIF